MCGIHILLQSVRAKCHKVALMFETSYVTVTMIYYHKIEHQLYEYERFLILFIYKWLNIRYL
jgi:hypothetical protein